MKKYATILLSAVTMLSVFFLSGCSGMELNEVDSNQTESQTFTNGPDGEKNINEIEYTTPDGETGYVYVPDTVLNNPDNTVPMVLMMCATGSEARHDAKACGWVDKALNENLIILAPNYNNYATYSQTDAIASAVQYVKENYPVDASRIYSTGFSNGGATSVAMCRDYPQLFAAISSMGWMVDMSDKNGVYAAYDMPFQVIQGTKEYTYATNSGAMAVMHDEQQAIRSLFLFNEMIDESVQADYDTTPYWGYVPDDTHFTTPDGREWTISNYYKDGHTVPFAQFVLIDGASHKPNEQEATIAWNFFKNYARGKDGSVIEREIK